MTIDPTILLANAEAMSDSPKDFTPEERADTALQLSLLYTELVGTLEPLKACLREDAALRLSGLQGQVSICSSEGRGSVTVTFPGPKPKVRKGVEALLEDLTTAMFDDLFDKKVTYTVSPRMEKVLLSLVAARDTDLAGKVMSFIDVVEPTPRVGFRPSSREEV